MRKNFNTLFSLFLGGLFFVACSEDELIDNTTRVVPGQDIIFGVKADANIQSRTIYGDKDNVGTDKEASLVEVNWVNGDKIQIASPDVAGTTNARYQISGITDSEANGTFNDEHKAATLEKIGEVGLQWSNKTDYTFYAMYPSYDTFTDEELAKVNLDENKGIMTGYLPTLQNPRTIPDKINGGYTINPDMRYAYMVAKNTYSLFKQDETGKPVANDEMINLNFSSLVTALQFDITANTIGTQSVGGEQIKITSVSLYSYDGKVICGGFEYNYADQSCKSTETTTGFNRVTMEFPSDVILQKDEFCDVTFFLLPTASFKGADKDLKLQIFYEVNGTQQVKTATLGVDIEAKYKYFFNDLYMPTIDAHVNGSSWFSALDPNTYISQLSIPVAGNAFSSYYSGNDVQYNKEQVWDYKKLWNLGVRGFEFKCAQGAKPANNTSNRNYTFTGTLEDEYFVTNGQEMTNGVTFGKAFTDLEAMLDIKEYENECLIVIATYQSYTGCGAYDPQAFINDLEKFITDHPNIANRLVKLEPTSTVENLQGKIAIIVRPADNDFIAYADLNYEKLTSTNNKLLIVDNWGTSVDCWDRRFGSTYSRQKVFGQGDTFVEDYLYGVSTSSTDFTAEKPFSAGYPTTNAFNFSFNNGNLHIQEFARIVPANETLQNGFYAQVSDYRLFNGTRYLWVKWPESLTQKKAMIDATLTETMATKGGSTANKIFINSLCGYYVTPNYKYSYLPYAGTYSYSGWDFSCNDAGMGGDIAGLSADLNKYFYDEFKKVENTDKQGPLGLVMMNYIGAYSKDFQNADYISTTDTLAATASQELPNLILMNNFKFPLATKKTEPAVYNANYGNNINAISFE